MGLGVRGGVEGNVKVGLGVRRGVVKEMREECYCVRSVVEGN